MSVVRKWNVFLRALIAATGILVLGVGALRLGVIGDPRLALWPTFDMLHLDRLQGPQQPLSSQLVPFAVQVMVWTLPLYLLFNALGSARRSLSHRR